MTSRYNTFGRLKHGASLYNQAEGLSLSVTNPNDRISLVENWNQLAYIGVAWSEPSLAF